MPTPPAPDHLALAARLAVRGRGYVEPNPPVGCVVTDATGAIVGCGHHRRFGGPHAEIDALARAGARARGGTAYVTLEPCTHTGKTPPCTEALLAAGIARVVIGCSDPNPPAAGGAARLRKAGVRVEQRPGHAPAETLAAPFVRRVRTGLPWVVAKWAQTIDGRVATRTGESQWISGPRSRRLVHRERGRMDAILTGIGTVRSDDPLLTARGVRVRRVARRVVVDPALDIPADCRLVATARTVPVLVGCTDAALAAHPDRAATLRGAGVEVVAFPDDDGEFPLAPLLARLVSEHDATNVLVEAGTGLVQRLLHQGLANEAWVFIGPLLLGDEEARPVARGRLAPRLADGIEMTPTSVRRRGDDVVVRYRVGNVETSKRRNVETGRRA